MEKLIWAAAVVVIAIIFMIIYKIPIGKKIGGLSSIHKNGANLKVLFDLQEKQEQKTISAMISNKDEIITVQDVSQALRQISDLDPKDIDKNARQAHSYFLSNGIQWKNQLTQLVTSSPILNALRKIYIEELLRPKDKPIDPIAVSTWGSKLFMHGTGEAVLSAIRESLKHFPEYKRAHRVSGHSK